jgi:hypothetical protein
MRIRFILLHLKLSDTQAAEAEVSALLIPNMRCSVSRQQVAKKENLFFKIFW